MNERSIILLTLSAKGTACLLIAAAFGIAGVLGFLVVMFQREAVKRELNGNGCQPLRIRWRPLALRTPYWGTYFRVTYLDPSGLLHKGYCRVYKSVFDSPFGARRVRWLEDEVARQDA